MNPTIIPRRFTQFVLASTATAVIANLTYHAAAQTQPILYGASISTKNSTAPVNTTPHITLKSFNLATGAELSNSQIAPKMVTNVNTGVQNREKSTSSQSKERLTSLTTLFDGTLVATIVASSNSGNENYLLFIDPKTSQYTKSLKLLGLPNKNSRIESLLPTKINKFISIISLNQGAPPFELATIDPATGKVTSSTAAGLPKLESDPRYHNLAQAPDGKIYATTLARQGSTRLVLLDLANKSIIPVVRLSYKNQPLKNDLLSLTISSSNQFYALANPDYERTNSLFTVDMKTGVLTLVKKLDAEQIAF